MNQTATERAATFALAAYTAPVRAELQRWLRQGLTLRQMSERIPTLRFHTRALAALLHHTYATALLPPADAREAEADAVLLTLDTLDALLPTRRPADGTTAANPYGCGPYGHGKTCPTKTTPQPTTLHPPPADSTPPPPPRRDIASRIDPARWKPVSRPRQSSIAGSLRRLRKGITVKDPTGKEMKLTRDVFKHWVLEGKTRKDIRRRLRNLDRIIMAIRQPHEIWQNEKGERIYLSVQQYVKKGKTQGEKTYYIAISLKAPSCEISSFYHEDADKIKKKREGICIYKRRP